jgi:spore germination protein
MELAFELLREAGTRLPGPIGSTIGIVGGLIIGQAAVEAKIVSPIVVIVVAVTAISSFAIPDNALTVGFRLVKYLIIGLSSIFGLYGFLLGVLIVLIHLVSLKSFNMPYMSPFVASGINDYEDLKDSVFRLPVFMMNKRPIFSRADKRVRLRTNKKKNE